MAGIYIHIPFCKKACFYCDFYFSVNLKNINALSNAIVKEIQFYKSTAEDSEINTIYFGGGTPSLLPIDIFTEIIDALHSNFNISKHAEWTIEINPDDVSHQKAKAWKKLGFNRVSLGIQSFFDHHLKWMNRAHSAQESHQAINTLILNKFTNISVDLIFGFPILSNEELKINLESIQKLPIHHLSLYSLTVEEHTPLEKLILQGKYPKLNEGQASEQYLMISDFLEKNNWNHYEISNSCRHNCISKHNTSYWNQIEYYGIGPSASSYFTNIRRKNVSNNNEYIKQINENNIWYDDEILSKENIFNEFIMCKLRLNTGLDIESASDLLGQSFLNYFDKTIHKYQNYISITNKTISLNTQGRLIADKISASFFI